MPEIGIGDLVQLKGGSPALAVIDTWPAHYVCAWFVDGEKREDKFPLRTVEPVAPAGPKQPFEPDWEEIATKVDKLTLGNSSGDMDELTALVELAVTEYFKSKAAHEAV